MEDVVKLESVTNSGGTKGSEDDDDFFQLRLILVTGYKRAYFFNMLFYLNFTNVALYNI